MDPLHSPSWYRVADLRPRVDRRVRFHRHQYRGEVWYVVQNPTTGRVHRLTPAAHTFIGLMDGQRTTQEVWDLAVAKLGDEAPTQDEALWLLGLLHMAELLRCDVPPDTQALFRRLQDEKRRERRRSRNPIAFRVPLPWPKGIPNPNDPASVEVPVEKFDALRQRVVRGLEEMGRWEVTEATPPHPAFAEYAALTGRRPAHRRS